MGRMLSWLNIKMSPLVNIRVLDEHKAPEKPGVYIMLSDKTEYTYPRSEKQGTSQVFYIGQSSNLRNRLKVHKRYCIEKEDNPDPKYPYYFPRYEYGAYHGCNVCWATYATKDKAKKVERDLLIKFADSFGAKPVANGQSAWR